MVLDAESGYYGDLGKVSRTNGSTLFCDGTNDLGRPTIDPANGQIYAITNAGGYNTLYSATAAGSLTSAGSCEGYTDLNPADGMLYRGGGGCGLTLYQMNKSSLGATNWSLDLSSYITSFDALAVQPWSGGYIYVASVSSSKIVVVDPITRTVVRTFPTAVTPNNIAVNPSGGNLYLTNGAGNFVYAYSSIGTLVWTSPNLGGTAYGVAAPRGIVGTPPVCTTPPSGMVSWWPGDGNAHDIKGGNDGTLQNFATFATAVVDRGFSLNGSTQYVSIGNPATLKLNSLTIDAWVKPTSNSGGLEAILTKWNQNVGTSSAGDSYGLFLINNGGTLQLFGIVHQTSGLERQLQAGTVPLNVFSHVAMTYNAGTGAQVIYVNGVSVASQTVPALGSRAIRRRCPYRARKRQYRSAIFPRPDR